MRRRYKVEIEFNGIKYRLVVIDPHFEIKHGNSMDDVMILLLLNELNGRQMEPVGVDRDGFGTLSQRISIRAGSHIG